MQNINTPIQPVETKSSKFPIPKLFTILILIIVIIEYLLISKYICPQSSDTPTGSTTEADETTQTRGIMLLIEYKNTEGLVNFVNDLYERNIHSLLSASPDFVEENCDVIKKLLNYNVELVSQNPSGSFWDIPYEEQYELIKNSKDRIETCTGKPLRVVSSRYFASDENTVKAAEELGIPYVLARGTTDTEAIVFKPEEYDVSIISVSNIPSIKWMYGSLCDYSYWVREGTPEDMEAELIAGLENKKMTPVTHTNIGGYKSQWNNMWLKFFDNNNITWQTLDEFATADMTLPMWQIPRNKNAPYTPTKRPIIPYDEEENVQNPCAVDELPTVTENVNENKSNVGNKLVTFHNGKGPMCLDMLEFLETINYTIEEHLDTEENFRDNLNELKTAYGTSQGVSESFDYYPIIFIQEKSFSGFDEEIKSEILEIIENS